MTYITLDRSTAEELAALFIAENNGADALRAQRPLDVVDQGETILIKGTPYQDREKGLSFCSAHVIFSKSDAETLDYGVDGRLTLSAQQEAHWRGFMSHDEFDRVFRPRRTFDAKLKSPSMDLFRIANGGLLNSAPFVAGYAAILVGRAWRDARIDTLSFRAEETNGLWRVTAGDPAMKVIELARSTGCVCWLAPRAP